MAEGPSETAAVELDGVEVAFPGGFRLAVDRLRIAAGERVACVGPSGSGKTTLVNVVAGALAPDRGRVRTLGRELTRLSDGERRAFRRASIGLVFQELELVDYLTALDNVLLPRWIGGRPSREDRERARRLVEALGIAHVAGRKPARLSQGERQRVAIARALVTGPELLLCDEPTGNLDPVASRAALELLFAEAAARGTALLCVTHDHGLLERFDRTIDVAEFHAHAAGSLP
jgi:ABC-type lipoprotein export system ATPase subunit